MAHASIIWPEGGGEVGAIIGAPGFAPPGMGPAEMWPRAFRAVLETMLVARQRMFLVWGRERILFYNDALLSSYPEQHPHALGRPYSESWPEQFEQFRPLIARLDAGEALLFENMPVKARREGVVVDRWANLSFTPVRDDDGQVGGFLCISADQTDRVLAEARERDAIAALEEKTAALETINRAGVAITGELDTARVTQIAIDAGVALTGAEFGAFFYNVPDRDGGSYMLYALSGVDRSAFDKFPMPRNTQVFAPTFNGEGIVRVDDITADHRYGHTAPHHGMPEGHLPVRSYLSVPVRAPSGSVIGGLFFGHAEPGRFGPAAEEGLTSLAGQAGLAITNARLVETLEARVSEEVSSRRAAEVALLQAQKMETIGKLTGGVAHDFNNLLQVVSGNLQLLAKDLVGNERAERRIANAMAGVGRGSKLASQLLAFGRRQPLEPRVVNIGRFLGGIDDMLRRALGEAISIETVVSGGLWNTMVDPAQMENAVLNLAINARDAMGGAGTLTIEAGNAFIDDTYSSLHVDVAPGQYVMLAVTDSGSGIPPELIEQVFEPFFSTKAEGKGSGMGLSMVYGFVKQSGGHVKIYSEVGEGTTVRLYLPRADAPEDAAISVVESNPVGGRETILVAEDDDDVRTTVVELLIGLGYRVLKAGDAASALSVIDSGVAIDLLFTDVVMPGSLKSAELARMLRQRAPGVAVLFTSGYTENSIVHDGRLDAGVDLLSKPYTREALARKVRQVLDRRSQPSG